MPSERRLDVADLVKPQPGTLRHTVIKRSLCGLVFQQNMVVELKEELII